jgi:hypothetical protein
MKFNSPFRIARDLKTKLVLMICLASCSCYISTTRLPKLTDDDLVAMDPMTVVETYWQAALRDDNETIGRLVGEAGDVLLWNCRPSPNTSNTKFALAESSETDAESILDRHSNTKAILLTADVIRANKKKLHEHYKLIEYKAFGNEARLIYERRENATELNTEVFFLLRDDRWRIVDTVSGVQLQFIGNQKFGEPRNCPD